MHGYLKIHVNQNHTYLCQKGNIDLNTNKNQQNLFHIAI